MTRKYYFNRTILFMWIVIVSNMAFRPSNDTKVGILLQLDCANLIYLQSTV